MRALQDIWSVQGRNVLAAFDLSPFPLICDLGGECPLQASEPPLVSPVGSVLPLLAQCPVPERRSNVQIPCRAAGKAFGYILKAVAA